jgi:hypothetical protein
VQRLIKHDRVIAAMERMSEYNPTLHSRVQFLKYRSLLALAPILPKKKVSRFRERLAENGGELNLGPWGKRVLSELSNAMSVTDAGYR